MNYKSLSPNGISVSPLCLGTSNFGSTTEEKECFYFLDCFFDHGGNFVDTAHVYSNWLPGTRSRSEKIVGNWLQSRDRNSVVLATKGGHFDFESPTVSRVTKADVTLDLKESLRYLKTDYIDVYFLHRDNLDLPVGEIMEFLNEIIQKGYARQIGCSNWTLPRLEAAQEYAQSHGLNGFVTNQLMWSMAKINLQNVPSDYITMDEATYTYHKAQKMSAMCYTSQAKGYFAKRFSGEPLAQSLQNDYENPENDALYLELVELSKKSGHPISQLTLDYFDQQDFVSIPIVSWRTREQMESCLMQYGEP